MPVVAPALLAGLHGPRVGRTVLFTLPATWLAGSLIGLLVASHVTMPAATAAVTITVGAMRIARDAEAARGVGLGRRTG